jgi:hypothetical protein
MTLVVNIGVGLALAYLARLFALLVARPKGSLLGEAMRLQPDRLRPLRRLAADSSVPRAARVRLALLLDISRSRSTSCRCSATPTTPSSSALSPLGRTPRRRSAGPPPMARNQGWPHSHT